MIAGLLITGLLSVAQAEIPAADPLAQSLSAAVRAHVATAAGVSTADVELRWLGLGVELDCPVDAQVLVDSRPGENFRGRTELWVTIVADGQECTRLRLPARLAIWQDVQVAATDTRAGEPVEMVAGRASRNALRGDSVDPQAGSWIAVHTIRAGAPVTDRDVILAPAVRAGDSVVLEAVSGPLRIEADAHMLNDGHIGEHVRVANTATGSVVTGVLVNTRTVRVGGSP